MLVNNALNNSLFNLKFSLYYYFQNHYDIITTLIIINAE